MKLIFIHILTSLCHVAFWVFFSTSVARSQTNELKPLITGVIFTDVQNLLPEGKVIVDIMDGVKQNPRQEELTSKFQAGVVLNYEWFVEYIKTVPEGEPLPYHQNLGLTESEYRELQGFMKDIELASTRKVEVLIKKKKNVIYFEASDKLEILETVRIDLKKNVVKIGKYELIFSDTASITTDANGLKSKWKGYTWRLEEPKDFDLDALKDLESLKAKQYKFTVGQLEKNGRTYISVKGREFENGSQLVNFELPLIF